MTKFWPAAANATVRLREREHRRARTRRARRWPCLAGLARPESLRRRGRVCRRLLRKRLVEPHSTALVWPARLRRTAVGAPAFFRSKRCGIRCFLSPRLESERSLGWGRGLSGEKSLLQSEKCIKRIICFCQISFFDKNRRRYTQISSKLGVEPFRSSNRHFSRLQFATFFVWFFT